MSLAPSVVIPGRREAASPESIGPHVQEEKWIPGSSLRDAPE
ncbi:hypothetical protein ACVIW0_007665 [Bradyrhizobium sp. USDA 4454]